MTRHKVIPQAVSGPKQGIMQLEDAMEMATALAQDISTPWRLLPPISTNIPQIFGSVSKPCTPGEHQNSW
jgi:hypothetical protein